jgi:hypothetical protein
MARRQASFDDLLEIGSMLPWRVAVLLAIGAFLAFHLVAMKASPPAAGTTLACLGTVVGHEIIHCLRADVAWRDVGRALVDNEFGILDDFRRT